MPKFNYLLDEILRVASHHPFYNSKIEYPPHPDTISGILKADDSSSSPSLVEFPVITKKDMSVTDPGLSIYNLRCLIVINVRSSFQTIERLASDASPSNHFRRSSYTSATCGGWKNGVPMLFVTDSIENRRQREAIGTIIKALGIVEPTIGVMNIHVSGYLYRSLDLTTDAFEHAGATVLCAGGDMPPNMVVDTITRYHCNCLTGACNGAHQGSPSCRFASVGSP